MLPVCVLDLELDLRHRYYLFESKTGGVPEVYGQIVGTGGQKVLVLQVLQVKNCAFMCIHFIEQTGVVDIVDFEPRALLFKHEDVLELFEVIEPFHPDLVFLLVDDPLGREVALDDILEGPVVPEQSQLDDVVAELLPLHCLVPVDIHLLKEVDECQGQFMFESLALLVIVQVLQHA